jgi:opacity protein-like surface antigen
MKYIELIIIATFITIILILINNVKAYENFYMGISFSEEQGSNKIESDFINLFSNSQNNTLAHKGIGIDFVLGRGWLINDFYIGLETSLSLKNIKRENSFQYDTLFSNDKNCFTTKMKKKESYNLSLRGGYKLTDNNLIYSKLGLISSKFNIQLENNIKSNNLLYDKDKLSKKINKQLNGVVIGIGTELIIDTNYLLRFEFCNNMYKKYSIFASNDESSIKASIKSSSSEMKIGLLMPLV